MASKKSKKNEAPVVENNRTAELEARIAELEARLAAAPKGPGSARRTQLLAVLRKGPISIKGLAMELSTPENPVSVRNISSILTPLRKAGYVIHTDEQGRKYLVSEPAVERTSMLVDDGAAERDPQEDNTEFLESQDHDD